MFTIKYSPKTIEQLDFGDKDLLKGLCTPPNSFRSTIIYGRKGVGKRTRAYCILNKLYGDDINKNNISSTPLDSNKKISIQFRFSMYHLEVDPTEYNSKEFQVISQLIDIKKQIYFVNNNEKCKYYTYIIHNVDKLSIQSKRFIIQAIETGKNIRFILLTSNYGSLPTKMQSSTVKIRVNGPNKVEMKKIFTDICKKERLKITKLEFESIVNNMYNKDSIKEALYLFQLSYRSGKFIEYKQLWNENLKCIISLITKFNPKSVNEKFWFDLRELLIKTLLSSFEGSNIIKYILNHFIKDIEYKNIWLKIIECSVLFSNRMDGSGKDLVHLESFIINLCNIVIKDR
jgi:hypothetical protein